MFKNSPKRASTQPKLWCNRTAFQFASRKFSSTTQKCLLTLTQKPLAFTVRSRISLAPQTRFSTKIITKFNSFGLLSSRWNSYKVPLLLAASSPTQLFYCDFVFVNWTSITNPDALSLLTRLTKKKKILRFEWLARWRSTEDDRKRIEAKSKQKFLLAFSPFFGFSIRSMLSRCWGMCNGREPRSFDLIRKMERLQVQGCQ